MLEVQNGLNLTISQRGLLNVGRARPTDIFVTYCIFGSVNAM